MDRFLRPCHMILNNLSFVRCRCSIYSVSTLDTQLVSFFCVVHVGRELLASCETATQLATKTVCISDRLTCKSR